MNRKEVSGGEMKREEKHDLMFVTIGKEWKNPAKTGRKITEGKRYVGM